MAVIYGITYKVHTSPYLCMSLHKTFYPCPDVMSGFVRPLCLSSLVVQY